MAPYAVLQFRNESSRHDKAFILQAKIPCVFFRNCANFPYFSIVICHTLTLNDSFPGIRP